MLLKIFLVLLLCVTDLREHLNWNAFNIFFFGVIFQTVLQGGNKVAVRYRNTADMFRS